MHRSRVCQVVIDCHDLDGQSAFWSAALDAEVDWIHPNSRNIYRRLKSAFGDVTVLFQRVPERKIVKNRLHFDFETDDVEAEVQRLERLGARRLRREEERGFWFWVMVDPEDNEFCVLNVEYPELLEKYGNVWPL